jgi:hypothetical protein
VVVALVLAGHGFRLAPFSSALGTCGTLRHLITHGVVVNS